VSYLVEFEVQGGGRLLAQADADQMPDDLELATSRPGAVVVRAAGTLDDALDQLQPVVQALHRRLTAVSPEEASIEFGITLGAESGVIVAKGKADVHFTVTLTWKGSTRQAGATTTGSSSGTE
jgi:hypothetical protein